MLDSLLIYYKRVISRKLNYRLLRIILASLIDTNYLI